MNNITRKMHRKKCQGCGQIADMYKGHQEKADLWRNHHPAEQGAANSHIAVVGHSSQHKNLSHNNGYESIQLGCTCIVRYGFLCNQEVNQHFRGNNRRIAQIDDSQVPEEKYMGGLKLKVHAGEDDDSQVPCHVHSIDDQEHPEKRNPEFWTV